MTQITTRPKWRRRNVYRTKQCAACYAPMSVSPRGRPRKTCSAKCRQMYHRRHRHSNNENWANQKARAAERLLKHAERYRGRADETPLFPNTGLNITRRDKILLDLRFGAPLNFCQWCEKPMTRRNLKWTKQRCCSQACQQKFLDFLHRLNDGLLKYRTKLHPFVEMRLRGFSLSSREPQFVLRSAVRVCGHCGKPYPVYGPTSRYCSKRCRQIAWRRATRLCRFCRKRFHVDYRHARTQKYCSRACHNRGVWRSSRPRLAERACYECGALYAPSYRNYKIQKYCSLKCNNRQRARNFAARKRAEAKGLTLPIPLPAGLIPSPLDSNAVVGADGGNPCEPAKQGLQGPPDLLPL